MKSVMIIYNQANTERVEYMLDKLNVRGFTFWENVQGRGSSTGVPHRGTHTWPEMNNALMTVIPDDQVEPLLHAVRQLDRRNEEVGVKAFVWAIEQVV
ncbi:MAG: P-II family nitrogen regulator [Bacteroidales bacterium]|nr:P-II family nitrogen regulator [Bacteroidales bacterium]